MLGVSAAIGGAAGPSDRGPTATGAASAREPAPARPLFPGEPTVDEPAPVVAPVTRAEPVRVVVDALGLDAAVGAVPLAADGTLDPPEDPHRVGWFDASSRPGEVGRAVLVGHLDSTAGPAVFADLGRLVAGDVVVVEDADGAVSRFGVTAVTIVPKDEFPSEAVYGATPDAELTLITCAGPYDEETGYVDNAVVSARAIP